MGCGKSTILVKNARALTPGSTVRLNEDGDSTSVLGAYSLPHSRPFCNERAAEGYANRGKNPQLRAEFVYGYMCRTTANNLFYVGDEEDTAVYPCGAVGVLLNIGSNTQRYLGGGEITAVSGHSREIACMAITPQRDLVATGENGPNPLICVWRPKEGLTPVVKLEVGGKSQGVSLLAFSSSGRFLSAVDHNADQTVYVFEWKHRTCVFSGSASPGSVLNMTWCPGTTVFCTVGDESIYFWSSHGSHSYEFQRDRAKFNSENQSNFMMVVQWFTTGNTVTGDVKGRLHLWTSHKEPSKSYQILAPDMAIRSLSILSDQILVGGEDCKVQVLNATFKVVRYFETPSPPVSVDMMKESILCGLADGAVLEFGRNGRILLMDSHCAGELHAMALDQVAGETLVSTGEDNRIKTWTIVQRRALSSGILEVLADDDSASGSRAVGISPTGLIAVGHNDGHVTIRKSIPQINHILRCLRSSSTGITEIRFSKTGNMLAVGSTEGKIYVYDVRAEFTLFYVMESGAAAVVTIEWNAAGTRIRTLDGERIEKFWNVETGLEIKWEEGRMEQDSLNMFSSTLPCVTGALPLCTLKSHKSDIHIQGTSWGLVEYHTPSIQGPPSAYRMHAGDIRKIIWDKSDQVVLTCSAQDLTIVQWVVVESEERAEKARQHI